MLHIVNINPSYLKWNYFNTICRRSTNPKQSKHSSQIMCLSDNMENIPHNPQKQFITLNAGESEQLLKVYEIQLKTFNSTIA